jgi:hypothetical protein
VHVQQQLGREKRGVPFLLVLFCTFVAALSSSMCLLKSGGLHEHGRGYVLELAIIALKG